MENTNLLEALNNYSEGELSELLGYDSIQAFRNLHERELTNSELVTAVSTFCGTKILSNPKLRKDLIDRLSPAQAKQLCKSILASRGALEEAVNEVNDHYALLEKLASEHQDVFMGQFGVTYSPPQKTVRSLKGITPAYPMYPYQISMVHKVEDILDNSDDKRCMVHLPTGAGKTRTAMNLACQHLRQNKKGLVLWLADTSELCDQAFDEFEKAWGALGDREVKIYSYYSSTDISLGGIDSGMLIAGLQKMNAVKKGKRAILYNMLREHVSLIIFDEAHKAIASTYAQIVGDMFSTIGSTKLIGLTATPGRKLENDDEDERLAAFFGRNKVTMQVAGHNSPINYLVEEGYLAKANFKNVVYDGSTILHADEFSNKNYNNQIIEYLSDDAARNKKLLEVIKHEYDQGSSTIVFACSVEHARKLAILLSFEGITAYSLDSDQDDSVSRAYKIAKYKNKSVRVLINYGILTAGFDAPVTNVAIIARPTDSLVQYSQMAGRAMRGIKSKGNKDCTIYTVRDDIPAFKSVISAFSHWDSLWNEH
ncbi:DEAD/DEAH box helicase [Endozoicomonas sp. ALE010]|uniref:DEAD/DEAH box helicase n=1 Tax=Endozoicomonas sp. ALE010 TaxID=3403081 RepID=UPI003BB60765